MGLVNKWSVSLAGIAVATSVFAWGDDGIAGCFNKDGRAHFMMDDGSLSADPIRGLDMGDEVCSVWHGGGGTPPDLYPRVDIEGSDFAEAMVREAAGFSDTRWNQIQPETQVHDLEMFTAYIDAEGGMTIEDPSGEQANNVIATMFSSSVLPISMGDQANPELAEGVQGSVIVAYNTGEGIAVGRIPAERAMAFD